MLHYGDPEREFSAFSDSCALVALDTANSLVHVGADALELLHRLSTNDLLQLMPGRSAYTVLTSERGRIIDVLNISLVENEKLLLLSESPDAQSAVDWIEKFTIIEDSTIRDATAEFTRIAAIGPTALEIVSTGFEAELNSGEALAMSGPSKGTVLVASRWAGFDRVDVVTPQAHAEAIWDRITRAGAVPAGAISLNAAQVAYGVPSPGAELTVDANPLEVRLKDLVSFTKGCYVGQEVVARLDTYDKLQKRLVAIESDSALTTGTQLTSDGKRAGKVTSVSPIPRSGTYVALGLVRRGYWVDGTQLDCKGAIVTVKELPDTAPLG